MPYPAARSVLCVQAIVAMLFFCGPVAALDDARLLRFPDVNGDTVVFSHGGDLWTVSAAGGTARRITSGEGLELFPRFSPDGKWIAFTGQYDGTFDVYVMPASGGQPRRLTFYPAQENADRFGPDNIVLGWTPDGRILYRSHRDARNDPLIGEPWAVRPEGGPSERYPLAEAGHVSFSPDGKRAAITRIFRDFRQWKRYQGGLAQAVWIYDLATHAVKQISDWRGTNTQPMWIGDAIYYLSDREDWKLNLWRYDVKAGTTSRMTSFKEFDCKWAHAGAGKIAFENGGWIWLFDPRDHSTHKLTVQLPDDERYARRRWIKVDDRVTSARMGPTGSAPCSPLAGMSSPSRPRTGTFATSPTARECGRRTPSGHRTAGGLPSSRTPPGKRSCMSWPRTGNRNPRSSPTARPPGISLPSGLPIPGV